MKKLVILDSFALIFRAYYSYPQTLTLPDGSPINAVYGFTRLLIDTLKKFKPNYLVVVFDSDKPTIRSTEFVQYKANRKETDLNLINQIPKVEKIIKTFDLPVLKVDGYEADDIIGTIVERLKNIETIETIIVTGDQDLFQLIDDKTSIYLTGSKFSESKIFKREDVKTKLGVWPEQVPTYKSLAGDASDNIPGVLGIGPKTAVELISQFDTLDNIYTNIHKIRDTIAKKLEENYEIANRSLSLATIDRNVPIFFDIEETKLRPSRLFKVKQIFIEYGFNSLLQKLDEIRFLFEIDEDSQSLTLFPEVQTIQKIGLKSFTELEKSNARQFAVDFVVQKHSPPDSVNLKDFFVSDGDDVFMIDETNEKEFLEWLVSKHIITYSAKPLMYLIEDKLGSKALEKFKFEDLGFAAQILSGGIFDSSYESVVSFFEYPSSGIGYQRCLDAFKIFKKFEDEIQNNKIYSLEIGVLSCVVKMEKNGILFDGQLNQKLKEDLEKQKLILANEIYKITGFEFNLNSPKQISEVIFEKRGLPKIGKTKNGAYSTDENVLTKLKGLDPIVDLILAFREVDKIYNTYIKALVKYLSKDGRIYTTFDQMGTISGRFSSKNPNLQNIPKGIKAGVNVRNLFIADDGYELISFDYSQQELRILSALAKEEKMIEAFNKGIDIHALTASQVYNTNIDNITKEQRSVGKVINYSIIYGVSSYGLSESLRIDKHMANNLIQKFYENYPNIKKYFNAQTEDLYKKNFLETALGRKRKVTDFKKVNKFAQQAIIRELLNFPIQGTAADLMKEAMIKIDKILQEYDAKLLLQIHDEFLFEFKGSNFEKNDFITKIKEAMESVTNLGVTYKVDVQIGKRWGEMQ